ncbi:MAG: metallophosphoesterase [Verrucomicrobiota bacterium]
MPDPFSRRTFLKGALLTSSMAWAIPRSGEADDDGGGPEPLRFGLIADVHKDIMHDADARLKVFIDRMTEAKVDFIVQLGDFCIPKEENQGFLDIWNEFSGPRYHVLGNHDTDGGYRREQTVGWWEMPDRYYAFDRGGVHFVVLDGNDRPENHAGGYPRFMAADQLAWLRKDLAGTRLPTVVFSHQSLEREKKGGVQNGGEVRKVLEAANQQAGTRKVMACFSGHHHRDYVRQINNIVYPQINSASYHWVGSAFQKIRYSEAIDKSFPMIKNTVPYKDALFALVTVDLRRGFMSIEGRRSTFVGPPPWIIGRDRDYWDAATLTPDVSDWKMPL